MPVLRHCPRAYPGSLRRGGLGPLFHAVIDQGNHHTAHQGGPDTNADDPAGVADLGKGDIAASSLPSLSTLRRSSK